ncbi:MAG: DUF853 family protein, partial [Chromatiaceae bacterium]|nr:DUF853 family protein [Chromatiaceae bacterium]
AAASSQQEEPARESTPAPAARRGSSRQSPLEAFATSALRSVGSQLGRTLVRGLLGSLMGGRR